MALNTRCAHCPAVSYSHWSSSALSWRMCTWVHDRLTWVVQSPAEVNANARLVQHPPGRGDRHVHGINRVIEESTQPQGGAMTGRGAGARVEHCSPGAGGGANRAGERCVDARKQRTPTSVLDVHAGLT